jgi:hypothetical protein
VVRSCRSHKIICPKGLSCFLHLESCAFALRTVGTISFFSALMLPLSSQFEDFLAVRLLSSSFAHYLADHFLVRFHNLISPKICDGVFLHNKCQKSFELISVSIVPSSYVVLNGGSVYTNWKTFHYVTQVIVLIKTYIKTYFLCELRNGHSFLCSYIPVLYEFSPKQRIVRQTTESFTSRLCVIKEYQVIRNVQVHK